MKLAAALFGEKDNRHELLEYSGASRDVFLKISRFTDRRSAIDGSFLGFANDDYYFFLKTWHDLTATRSGFRRVLALAMPLPEACQLSNLGAVFELFPETLPTALAEYCISPASRISRVSTLSPGSLRNRLADALRLLIVEQVKPVVWLDDGNFIDAVSFIWASVSSSLRAEMRFRGASNPDDDVREWDLIATRPDRLTMWRNHQIASAAGEKPSAIIKELLDGNGGEISEAIDGWGVQISCFGDYEIIERVRALLRRTDLSVDDAATIIRDSLILKALHSPLARLGVDAFVVASKTANPDDLILLRNVDDAFAEAHRALSDSTWLLASGLDRSANDGLSLVRHVLDRDGKKWWISAVTTGLIRYFSLGWDSRRSTIAWKMLFYDPRSLAFLRSAARENGQLPGALIRSVYGPVQVPPDELLDELRELGWYEVHAAALTLSPNRHLALMLQARVEPEESDAGLQLLAASAEPLDLIGAAIESSDPRLVRFAASAFIHTEEIVPDLRLPPWQTIVNTALASATEGDIGHQRLDRWLEQLSEIEPQTQTTKTIWRAIGKIYPQGLLRIDVPWEHIGEDIRLLVQRETAASWLVNPLEAMRQIIMAFMGVAPISQIVTSEELRRGDPDAALALFESNAQPEEEMFLSVLSNILALGGSDRHGRVRAIIIRNRWHKAAAEFADRAPRGELTDELIALLKRRQRVRLAAAGERASQLVSDSEWWDELVQIAIELFPMGVRDRDILERSGASFSEIKLDASGSEQWHSAISSLRKGGLSIGVDSLLTEMLNLYQRNAQLKELWAIGQKKALW